MSRPPEAPLTAEEEAALRADHVPGYRGEWCAYDDMHSPWPCDEARLLATLDRDRAARGGEGLREADTVEVLDYITGTTGGANRRLPSQAAAAAAAHRLHAAALAASPTTEPGKRRGLPPQPNDVRPGLEPFDGGPSPERASPTTEPGEGLREAAIAGLTETFSYSDHEQCRANGPRAEAECAVTALIENGDFGNLLPASPTTEPGLRTALDNLLRHHNATYQAGVHANPPRCEFATQALAALADPRPAERTET